MACYNKKVVYLSEMEYGSKIKGAGFVRLEFRDKVCSLDIHISGVEEIPDCKYDIYVISEKGKKCEIGKIYLHSGRGEWSARYENGQICTHHSQEDDVSRKSKDFPCTEIVKIIVSISDTKIICGNTGLEKGEIRAAQLPEEMKERTAVQLPEEMKERTALQLPEEMKERAAVQLPEEMKERAAAQSRSEGAKSARRNWGEMTGQKWEYRKEKQPLNLTENEEEIEMDVVILNDKWDQLRQIYQVVHPYEDEREYISVQPKDFVIMTGDYQHLANNSFLLHGFYNYRHIILGREPDASFYLGVPGVYYEREKIVALMFGFEAFECKGGKAEAGRFGYYLRKVKI